MSRVYFDNAATTQMHPEVIEVMHHTMKTTFGNPSSLHQHGRSAKVAVENSRKKIAKYFNVSAKEIIFTSGGTEGNNFILQNCVHQLGVQRIITTRIEHSAVLNVVKFLADNYNVEVVYLELDEVGGFKLEDLESLLSDDSKKTLVSLMMVNNEIGNLLPIKDVAFLCKRYNSFFHSDTVQAIGLYSLDLKDIPIDFITVSAHKFHGPKGVGLVYIRSGVYLSSHFQGGNQEKGLRPGTENVIGIVGMEKAFDVLYKDLEKKNKYIEDIKLYCIKELNSHISNVRFNGMSGDTFKSSPAILNVRFPVQDKMLLFNLDVNSVSASSGSACQSGASKVSYVLKEILNDILVLNVSIRFSFSIFNNYNDVDFFIKKIKTLF